MKSEESVNISNARIAINLLLHDATFGRQMLILWGASGFFTLIWALGTFGLLTYFFVKTAAIITIITAFISILVYKKKNKFKRGKVNGRK